MGRPVPGECFVQKLLVDGQGFFPDILVVERRQNAMFPVGQKKPLIPLSLERRLQIIPELGELRGIYQTRIGRSLLLRQFDQLFRCGTHARVGGHRGGIGLLGLEPDLQRFDIGVQNRLQLGGHF